MINAQKHEKAYINPYLGGIGLGMVLFFTFFVAGKGLGASGALTRMFTFTLNLMSPTYVAGHDYLYKYVSSSNHVLYHWLTFMLVGVVIGSLVAGFRQKRMKVEMLKGPGTTKNRRIMTAFAGGILVAFGARLAGGCTSGLALTGAATLGAAGWVFFLSVFTAGLAVAYIIRREWL
ncbi:MAG: YeeE/YedE family protein [Deltaproteobacteria bacterium]|jgi:uncharacterized membrane protein YedE/YeeE|nr:YeeE/YedE family protein [Deltaproteobacteria bacterium]MBT4526354.1 YeeE/YedE family protein [Deltaproteobacteria bacterium]